MAGGKLDKGAEKMHFQAALKCIKGFNIPEKLADISRIAVVSDEFLA